MVQFRGTGGTVGFAAGAALAQRSGDGERIGRIGAAEHRVRKQARTIICTCSFAAWPTPTTDFLTRLAGYSWTASPAKAGTRR